MCAFILSITLINVDARAYETKTDEQILAEMQQMQDPNMQAMYQNWIFKNLYDQQREQIGKQESKLLNEQEKQIQAEKAKIETQLKLLDQELEACKQGEDKAVEQWKPNYVA